MEWLNPSRTDEVWDSRNNAHVQPGQRVTKQADAVNVLHGKLVPVTSKTDIPVRHVEPHPEAPVVLQAQLITVNDPDLTLFGAPAESDTAPKKRRRV